ncbi:MAG: hypothetical protein QXT86_11230 [Archaeoglobaceae archaeon]
MIRVSVAREINKDNSVTNYVNVNFYVRCGEPTLRNFVSKLTKICDLVVYQECLLAKGVDIIELYDDYEKGVWSVSLYKLLRSNCRGSLNVIHRYVNRVINKIPYLKDVFEITYRNDFDIDAFNEIAIEALKRYESKESKGGKCDA